MTPAIEVISSFTGKPWLDRKRTDSADSTESEPSILGTPTLIMNGERGIDDFQSVSKKVRAPMRNSSHGILPGGGGFPLREYSEQANNEVKRFCNVHIL